MGHLKSVMCGGMHIFAGILFFCLTLLIPMIVTTSLWILWVVPLNRLCTHAKTGTLQAWFVYFIMELTPYACLDVVVCGGWITQINLTRLTNDIVESVTSTADVAGKLNPYLLMYCEFGTGYYLCLVGMISHWILTWYCLTRIQNSAI